MQPKVHEIRAWNYAYRQARKGKWEEASRDRARFADRIRKLESIIAPVLLNDHRNRIYKNRLNRIDHPTESPFVAGAMCTPEEPYCSLSPALEKPLVLKMILRDDNNTYNMAQSAHPEFVESKQWF